MLGTVHSYDKETVHTQKVAELVASAQSALVYSTNAYLVQL